MTNNTQFDVIFSLGQVVITKNAKGTFDELEQNPIVYLERHAKGDWGNLGEDDKQSNNEAIGEGLRLLSKYNLSNGEAIYIITEADRSITTIMLTEDY